MKITKPLKNENVFPPKEVLHVGRELIPQIFGSHKSSASILSYGLLRTIKEINCVPFRKGYIIPG